MMPEIPKSPLETRRSKPEPSQPERPAPSPMLDLDEDDLYFNMPCTD